MRFITAQVWIRERIGDTDSIADKPVLRKRRIDLKLIRDIEESLHEDVEGSTACYDKFNEYLFTVNLPFEQMNTILHNYQIWKRKTRINVWVN